MRITGNRRGSLGTHNSAYGALRAGGHRAIANSHDDNRRRALKLVLLAFLSLDLDFAESFQTRRLEAYERLLMDVMRGNLTLFVRRDEQEAAWKWVEPILSGWRQSVDPPKAYTAGTWGPAASTALLGREGFHWHEEL